MKILNKLLFKYLPEIGFRFPAKTTVTVSIIFVAVTLSNSQSSDAVRQEILKSEDQAKLLSRQWNGDSIERSIALFSQTAKQREKLQNFTKAANSFREAAQLEFLLGNTSKSVTQLKESLRIENLHKLSADKAITLSLLSTVSLKEGKIDESENYLNQARALVESTVDKKAQASFTTALATLYEIQRKPEKALENYQKSSELWKQTGDSQRLAYSYIDSGIIYMSIGKPLSGIETIKKAEMLFQQIDDARGLAICRIAGGHLYNAMDEKQLALDSYKKAEKTFPDNMDLLEKARLYNGIGLIYEAYEEWNSSIDYRLKALQLFRLANYPYGQLATLPSLLNLSSSKFG